MLACSAPGHLEVIRPFFWRAELRLSRTKVLVCYLPSLSTTEVALSILASSKVQVARGALATGAWPGNQIDAKIRLVVEEICNTLKICVQ